jgi:outer membrane immunogenic protein
MRTLRKGFVRLTAVAGIGLAATAAAANGVRNSGPAYVERPPIWHGLYGGAHLGQADASGDDGLIGGVQLGYNWQASQVVYGVEGDVSLSGSDAIDWLASIRGRLGYLIMPNLLIYGTAGVGFVGGDETDSGFVYGFGVEGMFTDALSARIEYLAFEGDSAHGDGVDVIRAGLNIKLGR